MSDTSVTTAPAHGPTGITAAPVPPPPALKQHAAWDPHKIGMLTFLVSETAFFTTLILTYVVFMGRDEVPPKPRDVLSLHLVIGTTLCLLASSGTAHFAEQALKRGRQDLFCLLWGLTILLGAAFLAGTAYEWHELIFVHQPPLTISRNLFGTTYYTLVGFHAFHVTVGVLVLCIVFGLALRRQVTAQHHLGVQLVSWYWHFVDGVWVVVFTVVYIISVYLVP